jgi:hypothetical protein
MAEIMQWSTQRVTSKVTKTKKGRTGERQSQEHAITYFDISGIVHNEFILAGHKVNSTFYCDALR